jgi:hypothetical protein
MLPEALPSGLLLREIVHPSASWSICVDLVRQAKPGISTELKREQHDKIASIMKPTWR